LSEISEAMDLLLPGRINIIESGGDADGKENKNFE